MPSRPLRIAPAPAFSGRFTLPGDKSISHRAALLGAMAEGETAIRGFSGAADCESTLRCLATLGVEVRRRGADVTIVGRGTAGLREPRGVLDAGNSGSTLRMLAGVLAGRPFRSVLDGDPSLRRRPLERVAAPLRAMGARVETTAGCAPLTIQGGRLRGVSWRPEVPSAQVKTAVLLAGLQADGETVVVEPAPTRDHTERLLPVFGATVRRQDGPAVAGGQTLRGAEVSVPGDVSSAAFLVVAALVRPDSEVRIDRVLLNPGRTAFLDVLREMGAAIETGITRREPEPVGWIVARSSRLHGTAVRAAAVPALIDELPVLAVAGACAEGTFSVTGAAELRTKESDRIAALVEGLERMGADVLQQDDGLVIHGGRALRGAAVRSHGDHRIAMALAVAALGAEGPSDILDPECASVSFPGFYGALARGAAGG
jgi:3-phosphoshikimate 1-carboxyvinyltransferase